jgi:GR25 family glycosyltransferase involved in LPS biosynthesis
MEQIAGTFYINLEARTDRRQELEGELARIGISGERFPAFKTSPGIIGCGQSHSAVLKEAKARGYRNVLVLEDDFLFLVSKEEFWSLLTKALSEAPDYDVIMLGYAINRSEPYSETLLKVLDAQAGSGYIVNERFYDTLISTWDAGTEKLIKTAQHWNYACDQIWKTIQPASAWYAVRTRIGKQRPSFADTGHQPVWADYTNC